MSRKFQTDWLPYWAAQSLVLFIRSLPLTWVARLGRFGGFVAYWLDFRHRRVALANLTSWLGGEHSAREIQEIACENFRRIGENYTCGIKTAFMSAQQLESHVQYVGLEHLRSTSPGQPRGGMVAIGHFGNFELYARLGMQLGLKSAATYRGFRNPLLNQLVLSLRSRSGCCFFDRRTEAASFRAVMREPGVLVGLFADQHAGRNGVLLPFLGRSCSTSAAPAIFALRYRLPLYVSVCYRVGMGRWRIEMSDPIPTQHNGAGRSIKAITADLNRVFEAAIRRDPANWFWVHDRWKNSRVKGAAQVGAHGPAAWRLLKKHEHRR